MVVVKIFSTASELLFYYNMEVKSFIKIEQNGGMNNGIVHCYDFGKVVAPVFSTPRDAATDAHNEPTQVRTRK